MSRDGERQILNKLNLIIGHLKNIDKRLTRLEKNKEPSRHSSSCTHNHELAPGVDDLIHCASSSESSEYE